MKLIERINLFIDKTGVVLKGIKGDIGRKSALETDHKDSLVGAVNELKTRIDGSATGGNAGIDDESAASASTVYSSQKTKQLIDEAKAEVTQTVKSEILDGAEEAYDTLKEVGAYITQDKSGAAAMAEQIGKRLRIDESQVLTPEQKAAVEATLNLGDTDTDFVARFEEALK
ncbi:hypothetical protein [Neisseria montereyensis]|uniref:Phage protein n=1 Tax=Neisseria montereyensis TaxID=2973938 RepID=A0ABT2FE51_9NEIS|nr:hypothetical protein [Neisseria montereyensis]MCS4534230.1 hypothetical protein [Neisseria montereyensis]